MQTLWNKGVEAAQAVEDFTVGCDRELDMRLAKYDVLGSKALGLYLRSGRKISQPPELYAYVNALWGDENASGTKYAIDGAGRLIEK